MGMELPAIAVLWNLDDGVQVGYRCICGPCQPTASIFRDDPRYERHEPRLAEGPCCCGRFFVVGPDAHSHAEAMAERVRQGGEVPGGYVFHERQVDLPWGGSVPAVIATLPVDESATRSS